jgi:hypothetical protein
VFEPAVEAGADLGAPKLEQQERPVTRRWRFIEHSAQENDRCLGSAVADRRTRGLQESVDYPAIGGGLARQEVFGNAFIRTRLFGEESRGAPVVLCALSAAEL